MFVGDILFSLSRVEFINGVVVGFTTTGASAVFTGSGVAVGSIAVGWGTGVAGEAGAQAANKRDPTRSIAKILNDRIVRVFGFI
jgi:hypothetical protein